MTANSSSTRFASHAKKFLAACSVLFVSFALPAQATSRIDQFPHRLTDTGGNLVWSASYDTFGRASINTLPTSSAGLGTENNWRFAGQYFDAETGLHYNNRRYYDPDNGRYITRDPLGFEGGINEYLYARHNPVNFIDPTGEILPCLLINYVRCFASCMLISKLSSLGDPCAPSLGDQAKDCGMECLLSMLPLPSPCGKFGQYISMGLGAVGAADALNSFSADTKVHTLTENGTAILKPISQLKIGDRVLAWDESRDNTNYSASTFQSSPPVAGGELERGALDVGATTKASVVRYEPVTDIFHSVREQQLVHITLESGEKLTATAGHPMRTAEGWRDAVLLKRGGKLLVHANAGDSALAAVTIADVQLETTTITAFNLEVANAHTFFVGEDGYVVHNARSGTSGNNSASARGRSEHAKDRNGYERDVRLPGSRKRADYIDRKNKIIYELKPCNAKAIRRGNKQVKNYADTVNNANDSRWGTGWTGSVITY